jgi:tRNA threonylcarbamoyladenosine biosynthesis protein TsaE
MNIKSEQEMIEYGKEYAKKIINNPSSSNSPIIVELIGDVGTGKTTFTRGFAKGLGLKSPISSPSFTISKSYALPDNRTLIHYDFYRLNDPGIMKAELEESLSDKNNIIIIEWADSVANVLPDNRIKINIFYDENDSRKIEIEN